MNSPVYDVLLVAHVLAAVIGFGALAATGSFAAGARRAGDPRASAPLRNYFRQGRNWAGRTMFAVPLLGAALLATGDHEGAGEAWPWLGLALWLVAAYLATSRVWPAEREIQRLLAEPPKLPPEGAVGTPAPIAPDGAVGTPARTPPDGGVGKPAPVPAPSAAGRTAERALTQACGRAERAAALTSVCFVAALALMVVQPR